MDWIDQAQETGGGHL